MPLDRRKSPLADLSLYAPIARQVFRKRAHKMFIRWASGTSYAAIATDEKVSIDEVRRLIRNHLGQLYVALRKWKLAEARSHALGMELRLLRIGKEAPPDCPIETLSPPARWLKAFRGAGIETVNQLRCVDDLMLLAYKGFPGQAIDWAILRLDELGLSHAMRRQVRQRPGPLREYLTPDEVAADLKVGRSTVWRWLRNGELPAGKFRRYWRIRYKDISAKIRRQASNIRASPQKKRASS